VKLWLVRHAAPLVQAGVCYGRTDLAADAEASERCAAHLADVLPADCDLWASPRQRCRQLALALQLIRPDLQSQDDERLAEMDFGAWEGQRWDAITTAELQAWTDNFADYATGANGESVRNMMDRVGAAFDDASRQAHASGRDQVWITHAGVIRAAALLARGIRQVRLAAEWPLEAPGFGQWCTLTLHSAGNVRNEGVQSGLRSPAKR
jgi:alpha-ribazole phosphatase